MGKKYDSYGVREEEIIYLAQPGKKVVCALGSVDRTTVSLEDKLNDISELTFEIDKYYNGEPVQEYDWVDQYMLLYVDGIWFKIKEQPVENTDGSRTYKKVTAMSLETELQQYLLVGFKVNQGTVDSIEKIYQDEHELDSFQQVRFYNKDVPELSLVDAILDYADVPDWKIGYVDDVTIGTEADLNGEYKTLPYEVAGFDVESQDVYSFLTQDVSKTFSCMFQFDTENKLINVYRVDAVGYDTNIILGFRNLQNSLEVSCDVELCTAFEVRGDEDMTIDYVNFGTSQIEDISFFLDTKYMPQELIDKYNAWVEYRESRRPEYIELSGEYNTFLNTISEIMYRVPADGVENDWTTYEENDLTLALDNYNAMITQLEHLYVDDHGNFDLEALKASSDWELYKQITDYIIPSIKAALQKKGVDTSTNGTGNLFKNVNPVITLNWQTITEDVLTPIDIEDAPCNGVTRGIETKGGFYQKVSGLVVGEQYTISAYVRGSGTAKIEIALYNQERVTIKGFSITDKWIRIDASFTALAKYYECYFTGEFTICGMQLERGTLHDFGFFAGLGNNNDSLSAWETNWALYGTVELKNKLDSYNNAVESLEESGFDSPYYEGSNYSWEYHTKMYQKYNDYLSLIDDCQKAYDERCAELKVQEDKRDELAKKRQKIADDVQKENFGSVQEVYLGFTDEELDLLRTFINHRNYVNEHIIATDLDTEKEKVSQQYDLYLKAKERLYIESHPQYIYSDTVDNLYALPEFKEYHEDLKVGNFLWIEDSEEHFVKLRVVTIKYNPCTWDNDITIEFSNMVRGIYGTNDVASIIQSAIESTRNQIVGMTNNRDIISYTITSDFIRQLLKNPIMGNAISNGGSNAIASMTGQIDFLVSKAIKTEKITAEVVDAVTGNFQKIFTTYIEGDLASFSKTVTDFLMAGQIITDDVKAATGTFTNYLTGVKILGDLLEVNTVIAEKILLRGSDKSVVYQLNQLGELTTEMVENIEQYQFDAGKTIIADSITSREINVNDLWVTGIANMLNANIGTALINDLTALTSHLGTWYFHDSVIEGTYDSMLIGGYLQSKNYATTNGVVTAGCKIDLNNFSIDSPNFKISPSGNVEMKGTLAVGSKVSMGSVYNEDGKSLEEVLNTVGIVYGVDSSSASIIYNIRNGTCTPSSISFNAYYSEGNSKEKLPLDCYMQISYTSTGSTWIPYGDRIHCTNGMTAFNFLSGSHLDGLPVNTETGIITAVKCEIFASDTSEISYASKEITIVPSMNELAVLGFVEENNTIYVDGSNFYAGSIHTSALAAEVIKSVGCEYSSSSVYAIKGTYFDLATGVFASQNFAITEDGEVYVKGHIIADSLTLGSGVTIDADDIYGLDNKVSYYVGESGAIIKGTPVGSSTASASTTSFKVSTSGLLEASNAIIYGTIYASAGSFTGSVNATSMTAKDSYKIYVGSNGACDVITASYNWNYGYSFIFGNSSSSYIEVGYENGTKNISLNTQRVQINAHTYINGSLSLCPYSTEELSSSSYSNFSCRDIHCYGDMNCSSSIYEGGTSLANKYAGISHTHSGYATASHTHSGYASSSHTHDYLSMNGNKVMGIFYSSSTGGYGVNPDKNGERPMGSSNYKWKAVYATNGTIQTSDKNEKENINILDERYEKMFMELRPVTYMWKDAGNGLIHDRLHCGLIAQEVNEAAENNGLSAETFAAICRDDLEEPTEDGRTETWGLNYGELHGLEIHMIQKALKEIEDLKDENKSLKERINILEGK